MISIKLLLSFLKIPKRLRLQVYVEGGKTYYLYAS